MTTQTPDSTGPYPIGTPLINFPHRISSTQYGFNVFGSEGVYYTVQAVTNLSSTNWVSLFTFQLTNSLFSVVDSSATNAVRFYRVKKN